MQHVSLYTTPLFYPTRLQLLLQLLTSATDGFSVPEKRASKINDGNPLTGQHVSLEPPLVLPIQSGLLTLRDGSGALHAL